MTTHEHHEELIRNLSAQLQEILQSSEQAIYIYLDDAHKVCNQNFANLLGYASPDEWAQVTDPFPQVFVAENSQETLVSAFQRAMQQKTGSTMSITWKKKDQDTVDTTVILVPISFEGHLFALHFIAKK